MNDLELKHLWQAQPVAPPPAGPESLIISVRKKMKKLDRTLFWRDCRELVACVFVMVFFGWHISLREPALALAGRVVIELSCIVIAAIILRSRPRRPKNGLISVRETLQVELSNVQTQIRLLRSVFWWYLLPLLTGCLMFFWGLNSNATDRIVYTVVCLLLDWVLYKANRAAARLVLEPLRGELEQTLAATPEFFQPGSENERE